MACPRAWRPLRYCVPSTLATRTYGSCQRAIPAGKRLTTDRRYAWSCYCASNYAPTSSSAPQTDTHTFEVSTQSAAGKLRLDNFLVQSLADTTRARLQALIKGGLVSVNGQTCSKVALRVRPGDQVTVTLLPPPPLNAEPEAIPLDIVYEDEEVLVINKEAGMVIHPAPGNYTGTLVNAVLNHCKLPIQQLLPEGQGPDREAADRRDGSGTVSEDDSELSDEDDDEPRGIALPAASTAGFYEGTAPASNIRPGIVHRLDKGTTGLLVVAKTERALHALAAQFKERTVKRTYLSVTLGMPSPAQGRVEANVARDPNDRKKMAAFPYRDDGSGQGRHAASNYKVVEELCGGRAAVVAWKLDTGRTHQIRVHAKHIGCSLLGDDTYGGGEGAGSDRIGGSDPGMREAAAGLITALGRPALHAATLGFVHPSSGEEVSFSAPVPEDMMAVITALRDM